jgi:hypothetical protein
MARQGGMVEPSSQTFGLGEGIGCFHVFPDEVHLCCGHDDDGHQKSFPLDPALAPLFRMVANRLDEISGKRKRRT